jgi:hypothetical protein
MAVNMERSTPTTQTGVNVTTSSAQVLAANSSRTLLILTNDSDTTMYIKFGSAAVAAQGIRLNASGGSLILDSNAIPYSAVFAIHAGTGNKVLLITEQSG